MGNATQPDRTRRPDRTQRSVPPAWKRRHSCSGGTSNGSSRSARKHCSAPEAPRDRPVDAHRAADRARIGELLRPVRSSPRPATRRRSTAARCPAAPPARPARVGPSPRRSPRRQGRSRYRSPFRTTGPRRARPMRKRKTGRRSNSGPAPRTTATPATTTAATTTAATTTAVTIRTPDVPPPHRRSGPSPSGGLTTATTTARAFRPPTRRRPRARPGRLHRRVPSRRTTRRPPSPPRLAPLRVGRRRTPVDPRIHRPRATTAGPPGRAAPIHRRTRPPIHRARTPSGTSRCRPTWSTWPTGT